MHSPHAKQGANSAAAGLETDVKNITAKVQETKTLVRMYVYRDTHMHIHVQIQIHVHVHVHVHIHIHYIYMYIPIPIPIFIQLHIPINVRDLHVHVQVHVQVHVHAHTLSLSRSLALSLSLSLSLSHTQAEAIGNGSTQEAEESKRIARESHALASSLQTKMQEMVLDMAEITKARILKSKFRLCLYTANILSTAFLNIICTDHKGSNSQQYSL